MTGKLKCDFMCQTPETPQQEWKRKTHALRSWAMKNLKETLMILIVYSIWAFLFQYAYSRAGYSGLAISITVAVLYKIDRLVNKK